MSCGLSVTEKFSLCICFRLVDEVKIKSNYFAFESNILAYLVQHLLGGCKVRGGGIMFMNEQNGTRPCWIGIMRAGKKKTR